MNMSPCLRLAIWGDRYKTNDIFTWSPRLPPTLFYKTTWHPDPDMVVIWRHQSPIFLVWRDGLQDRQEASQDEGRRRAETTPHQNSQPRAGDGFHSEGSRKPKGGLGPARSTTCFASCGLCLELSAAVCGADWGRPGEGRRQRASPREGRWELVQEAGGRGEKRAGVAFAQGRTGARWATGLGRLK